MNYGRTHLTDNGDVVERRGLRQPAARAAEDPQGNDASMKKIPTPEHRDLDDRFVVVKHELTTQRTKRMISWAGIVAFRWAIR